jgi:hypothetical protein
MRHLRAPWRNIAFNSLTSKIDLLCPLVPIKRIGTVCVFGFSSGMQVVKAIMVEKCWRDLSISETNTKSDTSDELAEILMQAVEKKVRRTSLSQAQS